MNSVQYEEFCRYFIAGKMGIAVEEIISTKIPNPVRIDCPGYEHAVDLRWETGGELTKIVHIANAKWRGKDKVDQAEVMLLQQVRQKVAAHKAVMLTNVGFTSGAMATAMDDGTSLLIVAPEFDFSLLPRNDRAAILTAIESLALQIGREPYSFQVEHRGLDFDMAPAPLHPEAGLQRPSYQTRVIQPTANRAVSASVNRTVGGRGGPSGGGSNRGGGGFSKR